MLPGGFSGFRGAAFSAERRTLLNRLFVMDERYKQLLADFNEAMKLQLVAMRGHTINA